MNLDQLKSSMGIQVRLVPPCSERSNGQGVRSIDDEWKIESADREDGVRLRNLRTEHLLILNPDHVHHFTSAPKNEDRIKRGFLELTVYVEISGKKTSIMPIATGPARAARGEKPSAPRHSISHVLTEKAVNLMLQFIDTRAQVHNAIGRFQGDSFLALYSNQQGMVISTIDNLRRIAEQFSIVQPDLYGIALKQVEHLEVIGERIRENVHSVIRMEKADEHYAQLQKQMQQLIEQARGE